MKAVDTNVLVRFLVRDDEPQAARALARLTQAEELGEPLFVSSIVLCETVWVLTSLYRLSRSRVVGALEGLLTSGALVIGDGGAITEAARAYAAGKGDFADYVIRALARSAGCDAVVTFDGTVLQEDGFEPV